MCASALIIDDVDDIGLTDKQLGVLVPTNLFVPIKQVSLVMSKRFSGFATAFLYILVPMRPTCWRAFHLGCSKSINRWIDFGELGAERFWWMARKLPIGKHRDSLAR